MSIKMEQAIVSVLDFFASLDAEDEHADEACLFVVYALNGGVNHEDNKTVIYESDFPVTLAVPRREGYNFAGWYTDSNFTHKVTELNNPMLSEVMLFAKWTEEIDNYHNVEMYSYACRRNNGDCCRMPLTECDYRFWDELTIPGMPSTRESDYLNHYITEATQCMQGLCFTPEYILMTSYAESDTVPGTLMIFDRESGKYLVSLAMKVKSHLGGVTYDGENIWICHSEQKTLERIDYSYVQKIVESGANYCVDVSGISTEYRIDNSPSCIAYYGERIWVATHTTVFDGTMVSYAYDDSMDELIPLADYQIPKEVQGVAFDEEGMVYFSTSYGRKNSSYIKAYDSLLMMERNLKKPVLEVEMPPCSEEVVFTDGVLVVLFESASEKYFEGTDGKGSSIAPLDTLLEIEIASLW
ncbi:MAG: InlB B-repeat-containing protein [Lachnospiraceae bacterium]|nr:InlB B-repeat-containing protein [Lachnospiraceae bacterium]